MRLRVLTCLLSPLFLFLRLLDADAVSIDPVHRVSCGAGVRRGVGIRVSIRF